MADQVSQEGLPRVFRPRGVRIAALVLGAVLILVTAAIWIAFPQDVRDKFTTFQRLTVIAFGFAALTAGYALSRSRLEARYDHLVVVNGFRSREVPWAQIDRLVLRAGAPWLQLELTDDSSLAAMGIQGSDGDRAVRQVRALREILEHRRAANSSDS